jgi:two-component system, LytTR family, sensor kinase
MKKHQVEIKWQIIVYSIYAIIGLIQAYSEHPAEGISFSEFFGVINVVLTQCILVNAIGNWLMIKHPLSVNPSKYYSYLLLIFGTYLAYRYVTAFPAYIDITNSYEGRQDKNTLFFFFFISTINGVISFLVAFGLYSIKKSYRIERRARLLEQEVNEARLTILKHQFNPHFLYNTLSYMYGQARPVSDNLAKSILILSEMMRYSLDKIGDKGLVLIEKEVKYIENFLEIYSLRFDKNFFIAFEIEGILGQKKIVPLLLITFVENALKHGVINNPRFPITIKILINNNELSLFVENQKQKGTKDISSGIGLENTKNRLKLTYPNKHVLAIMETEKTFTVSLKLTI